MKMQFCCERSWWFLEGIYGGLTLARCQVPTKPLYHSPPQQDKGEENNMEKNLMGQDKGSLIKQKQRLCVEAKENKRFILYFPSAGDVQPLPGK